MSSVGHLQLKEAIKRQRELVEFIDKYMLPDAMLIFSGNRASTMKLKKGFAHMRRLIREAKMRTGKTHNFEKRPITKHELPSIKQLLQAKNKNFSPQSKLEPVREIISLVGDDTPPRSDDTE